MERRDLMVDVDDTLNRMQTDVLVFINRSTPTQYRFKDWTSEAREGRNKDVEELVQEFLRRPDLVIKTHPFKRALEGVQLLFHAGFNIHIVSARRELLHQTTRDWLEKHGFSPFITDVHSRPSAIPSVEFKVEVARKINAGAAFDDTKDVAEVLAANNTTVYLIRKPWNKELTASDLIIPKRSFYQATKSFLENYDSC